MHLVEIRRPAADLGAVMAQMRTWLDHRQTGPSLFELAFLPGPEIRFRLRFGEVGDAFAFASVFDGEVLDDTDSAVAA
jgi:hypothetical protein